MKNCEVAELGSLVRAIAIVPASFFTPVAPSWAIGGRVIFWFRPNDPLRVIGDLKALYNEDKALLILAPYVRPMPYAVAATAWTQLLGCPSYNDKVPDAMRAFRDAYRLKGPEYIPNAE